MAILLRMAVTTIKSTYALDVETVRELEEMARAWKVSKSEALRRAIRSAAALIRESLDTSLSKPSRASDRDPLYVDGAIYKGKAPKDLSAAHDQYLYDESS